MGEQAKGNEVRPRARARGRGATRLRVAACVRRALTRRRRRRTFLTFQAEENKKQDAHTQRRAFVPWDSRGVRDGASMRLARGLPRGGAPSWPRHRGPGANRAGGRLSGQGAQAPPCCSREGRARTLASLVATASMRSGGRPPPPSRQRALPPRPRMTASRAATRCGPAPRPRATASRASSLMERRGEGASRPLPRAPRRRGGGCSPTEASATVFASRQPSRAPGRA
jgi:hypothetical protein